MRRFPACPAATRLGLSSRARRNIALCLPVMAGRQVWSTRCFRHRHGRGTPHRRQDKPVVEMGLVEQVLSTPSCPIGIRIGHQRKMVWWNRSFRHRHGRACPGHLRTDGGGGWPGHTPGHDGRGQQRRPILSPHAAYPDAYGDTPGHDGRGPRRRPKLSPYAADPGVYGNTPGRDEPSRIASSSRHEPAVRTATPSSASRARPSRRSPSGSHGNPPPASRTGKPPGATGWSGW